MNINSHNAILKRQLAAIILMAAGWGWICGNFVLRSGTKTIAQKHNMNA